MRKKVRREDYGDPIQMLLYIKNARIRTKFFLWNNFVQESVTYCTKFICKGNFVQFKAICCTILGKVMGEAGLCSPCGLRIPFPLAAGALSKE